MKLFIRSTLFILFCWVFIKWYSSQPKTNLSSDNLCPDFGTISEYSLPSGSIQKNWFTGKRKVSVVTLWGEKKLFPIAFVTNAKNITDNVELENFLAAYSEVCARKPYFYQTIKFVREERYARMEKNREIRASLKKSRKTSLLEGSIEEERNSILKKRNSIISSMESLEKQIQKERVITYKIMGKVTATHRDTLVILGNSFPDRDSSNYAPGFVYNGIIVIKGAKKSDIVSPDYYSTKHVLAKNLYYVGKMGGNSHTFTVFSRTGNKSNSSNVSDLQAKLKYQELELSALEAKLKNLKNKKDELFASM